MTLPKNVEDAVAKADQFCGTYERGFAVKNAWTTIRAHLLSQDAEIDRALSAAAHHRDGRLRALEHMAVFESRLAAADALLNEWRDLVLNHNAGCAEMCDPDRCKYRPYLEANGRRCPECPVNDVIEIPPHLQGAGDEA